MMNILQNSCVKGSRVTTWFSKGNIDQEGSAAQMNDARKSLMNTLERQKRYSKVQGMFMIYFTHAKVLTYIFFSLQFDF